MSQNATLNVQNLQFSYKTHEVLKGLSFEAHTKDFVCVLGENGAGKTTLFRCILGLLKGYTGSIQINGQNAANFSAHQLAKHVAYIPQAHSPSFNFTALQTVLMGTNASLHTLSSPGEKQQALALHTMQQLNISHLAHRGYAEISGGERQLVLIARALAQQSKILLMDEPTTSLDYGNQFRVLSQIKQLSQQGYLILLSTHNPQHALMFGTKVLALQNGRTAQYGAPQNVLTPETLENLYHIPIDVHTLGTSPNCTPVCIPRL